MRFISADWIFPISSPPVQNGIIVLDGQKIVEIINEDQIDQGKVERHKGIILPGFVNTHCHLELSHMKGLAKTGTGLISFISDVVKLRAFEMEVILPAITREDKNMYDAGIQAVGDISNKIDTAQRKGESPIRYYTFVEMFDFMEPALLNATIENYETVFKGQNSEGLNKKSYVPHAPYSVSKELFEFINKANADEVSISIHNQETVDEDQLFLDGKGGFKPFYNSLGIKMEGFKPTGQTSIRYALNHLIPKARNLFVHNTFTTKEDIAVATIWSRNNYWVTCPNANLFIENRLPNYKNFIDTGAKMTIGTDSIMSNWQLSIWEEIKTIKKFQSYVSLEDLFTWATLNGAEALGYENEIGSIQKGKEPGLVLVDLMWQGEETEINNSHPVRLI